MADVTHAHLRLARLAQRIQSSQATIFISLKDADELMRNPPPKWTASSVLRALDGRDGVEALCCCNHPIRLDRALGDGVIEVVFGEDAADRIMKIEARRATPDTGSGV